MARKGILRAREKNGGFRTNKLGKRAFKRRQLKSIFELQPLEQRMFLSVTAPTVQISNPQATFPPADATVHPMNQIQLSWSGASGSGESVSGYNVLMYQNNAWGTVASVSAGTGSFLVTQQPDGTPLLPGTVYYFEVETLGSGGGTAYSNYLSIETATQETEYIDNFQNNDAGGWSLGMTPFPSQATLGIANVTGYYAGPVTGGGSATLTLHHVPAHTSIAITLDFLRLNLWQTGTVTVKANGATVGTYDMTVAQPRLEGEIDFDQSLTVGCSQTNAPDADYDLFSRFVNDNYTGNGGDETIEVDVSNVTEPSNEATGAAKWGLWSAGAYLLAPQGKDSPCPCAAGGPENQDDNADNGDAGGLDGFGSGSSDQPGDGGSSGGTSDVDPSSGTVTVNATDLSSSNFDSFGQARNWTSNTLFNGSGAVGVQTVSPQQSYLAPFGTGTLSVTETGNDSLWFDGSDASGWVERYGRHDTLQHLTSGPNANQYQVADTLGRKTFYYDFSTNWSSLLQGKLAGTLETISSLLT